MSVDIILKDIEWDGVNKIRVPLEGGGTQDFSIGGGSANLQTKSETYTPTTSQQTDTVSPDTGYDGLSSVNVTVNAIPTGSAGTPTATKGTVSNHSVSVTPSVTNTTGYITGGTKTGTSVSVSASELVSGSQTVAGNGTFDVTNLAQLIVDTPTMNLPSATSSTPTGTNKANIFPSTSQQYLNIPAGLNDTARYYQIIGMDLAPLNVTQNGTYNASDVDITGFNTVTVNVPGSTPNLQTKTRTYTPSITEQREVISADDGYDGLLAVGITVDPMPTLTLPNVASMHSAGTRKAKIYQSNYTQYWNIGTGYHAVAEYYEIPPLLVDTKTITTNGTYNAIDEDLDGYSSVTVNVPSGIGTLLATKSLGTISTTSTTATDTGQTVSVSSINGYDLLIVETSVDTKTNGRHASTMQCIWLTASSTIGTKNGSAIATATMNDKLSSSGTVTSRSSTTKYGIYVYSVSISNGSATLTMYQRYNSTQTGTINGSYTTRVYGVNLYDLIGG